MACAFCAATIEKGLRQVDGVSSSKVLVESGEVFIRHDPSAIDKARLKRELERLGYYVFEGKENMASLILLDARRRALRTWAIAGVGFVIAFPIMFPGFFPSLLIPGSYGVAATLANWIIATLALFYFALPVHRGAVVAVRKHILNEHVLYGVAGFGAYIIGLMGLFDPFFRPFFFIATLLTGLHLSAGWLGARLRFSAENSLRKLMDLRPPMARVIAGKDSIVEVPVSEVKVGDLIAVRPGERIPLDGTIVNGVSEVAEAILTGESVPVTKKAGDEVLGGSTNGSSVLTVKVSSDYANSYISRILGLVNSARQSRSSILTFFDRIVDRVWVPSVLLITLGTFTVWAALGLFLSNLALWQTGIVSALLVSVIGYPCAIGFSSPSVGLSVFSEYAENGILIKDSTMFERLKNLKTVIFDKTGTLTYGNPRVVQVIALPMGTNEDVVVRYAASLEEQSTHPVARAIVNEAERRSIPLLTSEDFAQLSGEGSTGLVDGKEVTVGRPEFLSKEGYDTSEIREALDKFSPRAKSPVLVGANRQVIGAIDVADTIRPDAKSVVTKLKQMGLHLLMVTGDTEAAAVEISKELGGIEFLARRTPSDKVKVVDEHKGENGKVLVVGDGLNDAAALAAADVGIATAASIDISKDVADAVLVSSSLRGIVAIIENSKTVARASASNILLALGFNAVGIPLAILGVLSASYAMMIMVLSLFAVFGNAYVTRLRLGPRINRVVETDRRPAERPVSQSHPGSF